MVSIVLLNVPDFNPPYPRPPTFNLCVVAPTNPALRDYSAMTNDCPILRVCPSSSRVTCKDLNSRDHQPARRTGPLGRATITYFCSSEDKLAGDIVASWDGETGMGEEKKRRETGVSVTRDRRHRWLTLYFSTLCVADFKPKFITACLFFWYVLMFLCYLDYIVCTMCCVNNIIWNMK